MKFQDIDRLAQARGQAAGHRHLGDRYAYHCLREVYERYLAEKLDKEAAESERQKIYQAHRALPGAGGSAPQSLQAEPGGNPPGGDTPLGDLQRIGKSPGGAAAGALLPVYQRYDRGGYPRPEV